MYPIISQPNYYVLFRNFKKNWKLQLSHNKNNTTVEKKFPRTLQLVFSASTTSHQVTYSKTFSTYMNLPRRTKTMMRFE